VRKTASTHPQLDSLLERDETPESGPEQTIDQVLSTPNEPPESSLRDRIAELSSVKTPKTLPRVAHTNMNPKDAHKTTANPPDSGFRLGFTDISIKAERSLASFQNTPTRSEPRQCLVQNMTTPSFEFKFATESNLSDEAQKLMENVRDEAARIKAQMLAERKEQDREDDRAEQLFGGVSAAGRKIAQPKGKAGRFSDIHMAEFKKMDSIANHASSFRTHPGFARPTTQSLKRTGSKAGLDEPERPGTAGKGTPGKPAPPFMRQTSTSPFKSILPTKTAAGTLENQNSAKRMRQSESHDKLSARPTLSDVPNDLFKSSGLPRAKSKLTSTIFSPTKSSQARSASTNTPENKSSLPRSNSVRSLKGVLEGVRVESAQSTDYHPPNTFSSAPATELLRSQSKNWMRALPPLPGPATVLPKPNDNLPDWSSVKNIQTATPRTGILASRLPTFSGLKSILRQSRAPKTKTTSTLTLDQAGGIPKRANTTVAGSGSAKKVDFTPSTKSRYAVKLAAATTSPSKASRTGASSVPTTPVHPYDSNAYTIGDNHGGNDEDWEDAESEVTYPTLPSSSSTIMMTGGPGVNTFSEKAKQHNRRESKEFKSIFTTLEHPSRSQRAVTVTDVNTRVNQTNPTTHANIATRSPNNTSLAKPSPSTIRHVRTSGVTELVQPFEDTIKTIPHGLSGKKRRRESDKASDLHDADDDAKENRRLSVMPHVPSGWDEQNGNAVVVKEEDEGEKRGAKKARIMHLELEKEKTGVKKPKTNAAREAAAKISKDRKRNGRGILSLSRLNMLARPKERK
jgi:hypothetical protein